MPDRTTIDDAFVLLPADDAAARRAFATCAADAAHGSEARRLAAAGMALAVAIDFADFRGLAAALAELSLEDRAAWPRCARPQDQARLDAALVVAPLLDSALATDDAAVAAAAERLGAALVGPLALSPDERMLLWKCLVDYRGQRMDTTAIARIAAQAQDFLRAGSVSPRWQAKWWLLAASNHGYFGASDAGADALARAQRLAQAHGLADVRYELLCVEMPSALRAEAWSRAEQIAREIEQALPDVRAGRLPAGLRAQAWWRLTRGEPGAALLGLDRLLAICEDVQVPQRDRGAYHVLRAYALVALGRHGDALRALRDQRPHQRGDQGKVLEVLIDLIAGLASPHDTAPESRERVCDAVRRCAALQFERFLLPLPAQSAQVAQTALDAGVETEFIAHVVRTRRLLPGDPTREDWPWRLQVRVLGTLQVLRDGRALVHAAKRPKKPLELLALIAAQGDQPLPVDLAIDALWPSPDAEAPRPSFEVALSRLRKLLDLPNAVLLGDGVLQLDARSTWSDVAAFAALAGRWEASLGKPAAQRDVAAARRAIALYRGPLLAAEPLATPTWQLLRAQLARRFAGLVTAYGAFCETQALWRDACDVYEQGLARDPLCEPLYRALMRAQLQLGERAEAMRTYARCRDLLRSVLGVETSPETAALRAQAAGAA